MLGELNQFLDRIDVKIRDLVSGDSAMIAFDKVLLIDP